MATLELDPVFVKALRLLHSKSSDSVAQLRAMVEDAIASRKPKTSEGESKPSSRVSKEEETKKREAEKRKFDKLKMEISELEGSDGKKSKRDSSPSSKEDRKEREREKEKAHKKEKERREQEKERERHEREKQKEQEREREREKERARQKEKEVESDESTEEDENTNMTMETDDFAFGLGVCCEVCSKFDVTSGNQLVECQECHALYHQECHKPPVTEQDVNDPRFVWYCNKCVKTMKKIAAQKPSKSKPTPGPQSSSKETSSFKKSDPQSSAQPFKRMEVKLSTSGGKESITSAASQPLRGLASLAANLAKPSSSKIDSKALLPGWKTEATKPSHKDSNDKPSRSESSKSSKEGKGEKSGSPSSSSGSSSSSKGGSGNGSKQQMMGSAMANANKRLQQMKKAAAKQQEKRVHIK